MELFIKENNLRNGKKQRDRKKEREREREGNKHSKRILTKIAEKLKAHSPTN